VEAAAAAAAAAVAAVAASLMRNALLASFEGRSLGMELSVVGLWVIVGLKATPPFKEESLPESVKAKLSPVVLTSLSWVRLGAPGFIIMSIVLVLGVICCISASIV
jgi:hypothetical protein